MKPTLRQPYSWPEPRVQFAFKDSMIHIICNSHYVSHFAAFFIDTGAKTSIVESCHWLEAAARGDRRQLQAWLSFGFDWGFADPGNVIRSDRSERGLPSPPDLPVLENRGADKGQAHCRPPQRAAQWGYVVRGLCLIDAMILPQVHLRKPCYDFSFL